MSVRTSEGQAAANSGTVADPDGDPVTLSASSGSVTTMTAPGPGTFPTSDGPAESQTVTIFADDGNGGSGQAAFQLTVDNVAPTIDHITIPTDPVAISDQPISVSATFNDPAGANDEPFIGTVNHGDGSGDLSGTVTGNTCQGPEYTYMEAGVYTVTVTVTDKDGASGSASAMAS